MLSRRQLTIACLAVGVGLRETASAAENPAPEPPLITVYKRSTCGCCRTWIKYLESHGYQVNATDEVDLPAIRKRFGVPEEIAGCHTATVAGYVIEGHVSVDEIERLLRERPSIRGLVVTGMPKGAPGMEGPGSERYDVLALNEDGTTSVFVTHEALPGDESLEATPRT